MEEQNKKLFYILMFIAMIGWGASWVHAKVLSNYINEYELIFLRNFFTIITMIPVLIISKKYFHITAKGIVLSLITAIVMILYLKYYFLGTKFGTASLGGAFVTTLIPINTFLIMALFFGKKIKLKDIFALILGAFGVLTILNVWTLSFEEVFTQHNIYFIFASILWPIITILSSKATDTSPLVFSFYMYIFMSIFVLLFFMDISELQFQKYDTIFWINILSIAIISTTFSTSVYFIGIEKLGTNEVSSFIFLVPFSAISLSIIFLNEKVHYTIFIGTILTLLAVKMLNNIKILKKKNPPTR